MKRYVVKREDLHHNIRLILEKAAGKTVWGVIKGDGYGLGVVNMARELAGQGIDHFAVTDVQEVRALRQAGFDGPVLMMSATAEPDTLRQLLELDAIVTVSSLSVPGRGNFWNSTFCTVPPAKLTKISMRPKALTARSLARHTWA